MNGRGDNSPRFAGKRTPFHAAFNCEPLDPFQNHIDPYPNREKTMNNEANTAENLHTNANTATNTVDLNSQDSVSAEATRLRAQADEMDARLRTLRAENDAAATAPSGAASAKNKGSFLKTTKKVLGWTLAVGVVGVASAFVYGKLTDAGVELPVAA